MNQLFLLPSLDDPAQWESWRRWARDSVQPSRELHLLIQSDRVHCYPELAALIGVHQDPEWHPEGDVWIHTLHVCDSAAIIARRDELNERETLILVLAALCHDFGKPETTEFRDGRWRASGHPQAGVPLARTFLERINCPVDIIEVVQPLVAEHLVHAHPTSNSRAAGRLVRRLQPATIPQLVRLIEADLRGRPPLAGDLPASVTALLERTQAASNNDKSSDEHASPIIQGRHLIALGYRPSVWFGSILKSCSEAQLNGEFDDEKGGLAYLTNVLALRESTAK